MPRKYDTLSIKAIEGELLPEEQTYQARLRAAIYDGVSEKDVAEIIKGITERAKAGDAASIRLFMDYVLGSKGTKQVVVNNHFTDVEQGAAIARKKA